MSSFLLDVCENLYFKLNTRIRDEKTRRHYRFAIGNLSRILGRRPRLNDLTDDNVSAVMMDLLERGRCTRTANERRDRLNALWTWLAKRGMVKTFPTNVGLIEPERVPVGWLEEEIPLLMAAFNQETKELDGVPAPAWWKTLHMAMWNSSERIGALIQCQWKHLRKPWLVIPAELRKGKRADKAYRLSDETLEAIESIRNPKRKLIWPWPHHWTYLWIRYKIIRERAGLPTDRYSSFHRMRKTVASHFEAAGGNATQLLGHSSRKQTMKYLDPRITGEKQAADVLFKLSPINRSKPPGKNTG